MPGHIPHRYTQNSALQKHPTLNIIPFVFLIHSCSVYFSSPSWGEIPTKDPIDVWQESQFLALTAGGSQRATAPCPGDLTPSSDLKSPRKTLQKPVSSHSSTEKKHFSLASQFTTLTPALWKLRGEFPVTQSYMASLKTKTKHSLGRW